MSILGSSIQKVEVKLYYKEIVKNGYQKIIIVQDEGVDELLKAQEEKIKEKKDDGEKITDEDKPIKVLSTYWKTLSWGEQNNITKQSEVQSPDGVQSVDYFRFRDLRIKKCLVDWDILDDKGNKVPVSSQAIDMLPSDVVMALLLKYDLIVGIDEQETEKN